jgi:cell division cycle protein 37
LKPWNVDTISQEGFSKTAINKQLNRKKEELSEEEKEKRMRQFVKENEKDLKVNRSRVLVESTKLDFN